MSVRPLADRPATDGLQANVPGDYLHLSFHEAQAINTAAFKAAGL